MRVADSQKWLPLHCSPSPLPSSSHLFFAYTPFFPFAFMLQQAGREVALSGLQEPCDLLRIFPCRFSLALLSDFPSILTSQPTATGGQGATALPRTSLSLFDALPNHIMFSLLQNSKIKQLLQHYVLGNSCFLTYISSFFTQMIKH